MLLVHVYNHLVSFPCTCVLYVCVVRCDGRQIIDLQREVLGIIGLDPDYGVAELNRVGQDYSEDSELHNKMQQFAMCAQLSCR